MPFRSLGPEVKAVGALGGEGGWETVAVAVVIWCLPIMLTWGSKSFLKPRRKEVGVSL